MVMLALAEAFLAIALSVYACHGLCFGSRDLQVRMIEPKNTLAYAISNLFYKHIGEKDRCIYENLLMSKPFIMLGVL